VQLAQFEAHLKRYNDVLEKAMALKFAIEGVLFDDLMQARSLQFMRYVIVFMLRVATKTDYIPGKTIQLVTESNGETYILILNFVGCHYQRTSLKLSVTFPNTYLMISSATSTLSSGKH
jgi:Ubiquitin elongating factor core